MADDPIQDDHPELPPRSAPKREREPIVIEGDAIDPTPREAEPTALEAPEELIADDPLATEREHHVEPDALLEPIEAPSAFEPWSAAVEAAPQAEAAPKPREPEMALGPPPASEEPPRSGFSSWLRFVGYSAGIIVIIVVALFIGALVHNPFSDAMTAAEQRLGAVEAALNTETSARVALEGRVAANEAKLGQTPATPKLDALDARVAKLEAGMAAQATASAAAAVPSPAPVTADAPASPTPSDNALADRVAKVEAALAAPKPAPAPDPQVAKLASGESALDDRIAKLETALAAQKSEARAAPIALAKGLDPVAEAVAAISLAQRLSAGEPYAAEFAALSKSGADATALAALKPWADSGAPTPATLAVAFDKLGPSLETSVKPEASGKVVDKMMDQLRGLVKVRVVGETEGDDPAALVSQISAALAQGDVAAALATEAKLPASARAVAAGWTKDAEGLESATSAARSLAETALQRFANARN